MRKRKRFLALILGAMLLTSAAACGSGAQDAGKDETKQEAQQQEPEEKLDAKQIFQDATEKNASLNSMSIAYKSQIALSQGEESMDMEISMDMTAVGLQGEGLQYSLSSSTSVEEQQIATNMYYKDNYYYVDVSGQKIKYAQDPTEVIDQVENSMGTASLDTNGMKNIDAERDGDNIVLTFEADPALMNDYVTNVLRSMEGLVDTTAIHIQKVTGTYVVNAEGYCIKTDMDIKMTLDIADTSVNMDMAVTADISPLPDDTAVSFPEDLDSYIEVDASQITGQ